MNHKFKICSKCILTSNYPFLTFDNDNVCHYCANYKKLNVSNYKFLEIIKNRVANKKSRYDCLVGLSGGRDSSYGLYLLKKKYGLNPLAYSYDWGFVGETARLNISKLCGFLGVELILRTESIKRIRHLISLNVKALLKDLKLGMVPIVQALDKRFIPLANDIAKENNINLQIHFSGFECEQREFVIGFSGINQRLSSNQHMNTYGTLNKIRLGLYYMKNFLLNKNYFNAAFYQNLKAFYYSFFLKNNIIHFYNFEEWNEKKIINTLKQIGYLNSSDYGDNQWRSGDTQTSFNNYIYYSLCGFTEFDEFRSHQIRMGHITREEALRLVEIDNKPKYDAIKKFCFLIDLDPNYFFDVVEQAKKKFIFEKV
jgi:hypothetical protein